MLKYPAQKHRVIFREVTGSLPSFPPIQTYEDEYPYDNGRWFYVELHVWGGTYGPGAIATVHEKSERNVEMLSLFVCDWLRREGHGRELIVAAIKRWPDLYWCGVPMSEGFHKKLVAKGIAVKIDDRSDYYKAAQPRRQKARHNVAKDATE